MTDPGVLSKDNTRVKQARRLGRRPGRDHSGLFLAEGPRVVAAALESRIQVRDLFTTAQARDQFPQLWSAAQDRGLRPELVSPQTMQGLTTARTPPGVVAVCHRSRDTWDRLGPTVRLVAVCVDIRDPGNAGTIIRTAGAAGAGAVVLAGDSVAPGNPKLVRASAGSLFHQPVIVEPDTEIALVRCRQLGMRIIGADAHGDQDLFTAAQSGKLAGATAWIFGNEAHGLNAEVAALLDERIKIPIQDQAESLNLAAAAAICLFTSTREQLSS